MVSLINISKTYRKRRDRGDVLALNNLSYNILPNKITMVVGPSGCGKTTLLNIISGLDKSFEGELRFEAGQRKVGYMFQTPSLIPWRTVWSNVIIGCEIEGIERDVYAERGRSLLRRYGLAEFAQEYPHRLSQGMQQRVAFIRQILYGANLLLLDEPFSRLDYVTRRNLYRDLDSILSEDEVTILAVTHDIEEAVVVADQIVILSPRPGRVLSELSIPLDRLKRINSDTDTLEEMGFYLKTVRQSLELTERQI